MRSSGMKHFHNQRISLWHNQKPWKMIEGMICDSSPVTAMPCSNLNTPHALSSTHPIVEDTGLRRMSPNKVSWRSPAPGKHFGSWAALPRCGTEEGQQQRPRVKEGPWPRSALEAQQVTSRPQEGFLPPRRGTSLQVRCEMHSSRDTRQKNRVSDLPSCLHGYKTRKNDLSAQEHYQVNCTSAISVGSIHMKL